MDKSLGEDLLYGARQIAAFVFNNEKEMRKIYHLSDSAGMPTFRIGGTICARKSSLIDWVAQRERRQISQ